MLSAQSSRRLRLRLPEKCKCRQLWPLSPFWRLPRWPLKAHADVMLPYGQPRPLSLYLVTVAASGDRKSTADNEALWPVRKHEKALKEQHDLAP